MKTVILILLFVFGVSFGAFTSKDLRCAVCRAVVKEMNDKIETVNDKKKIQVGGYRLDESGNLKEKLVPFARSGMHLSELMDEVCEKMTDYVRATHKLSQRLVLLKLIGSNGGMNPDISEYDIVQDGDLNQSLNFYCEGVIEEFEDEIYNELKQPTENPVYEICTTATKLCSSSDKDEL